MKLNLESRAVMAIESVYSSARIVGMTSRDISNRCLAALAGLPKSTPRYVRAYADGFQRALVNQLYAESLVFGGWIDGRFYSTDSQRPDYYAKNGIDAADWHKLAKRKGHYWRHNLNPYFADES